MADVHSQERRSYNMSRIRSTETKPELIVKEILEKKEFIYQPEIYGKPDFANFNKKVVIFIDGCFWHKCSKCFVAPKTKSRFWANKINGNVLRDKEINLNYYYAGWKIIRIWEHLLNKNPTLNYNLIIKEI